MITIYTTWDKYLKLNGIFLAISTHSFWKTRIWTSQCSVPTIDKILPRIEIVILYMSFKTSLLCYFWLYSLVNKISHPLLSNAKYWKTKVYPRVFVEKSFKTIARHLSIWISSLLTTLNTLFVHAEKRWEIGNGCLFKTLCIIIF